VNTAATTREHLPSAVTLLRSWLRAQAPWLLVFMGALAVRVLYNLTVARHYVPTHDAQEYVLLGERLASGKCYCLWGDGHPSAYRSPGFPLFLTGVFLLFGPSTLAARLALSIVGALTCVLSGLIARDLFGARAGVLAGALAAVYPQLFINDAWLNSESLAICLFAASCLVVMRLRGAPLGWRWIGAGALLGALALTRPNGFYGLIATLAWLALAAWQRRLTLGRAALGAALVLAAFILVLTPWVVRNAEVTGAFVPFSTGGGDVIAGAYTDAAYRGPDVWQAWINPLRNPTIPPADRRLLTSFPPSCWGACEVRRDAAATGVGLRWARSHLLVLPWLIVLRWIQTWIPAYAPDNGGMPIWRPFAIGYPALVILLAPVGLYRLRRRWDDGLVPALLAASVVVGCLVFYGSPRLRAPMEPLLLAFAAGAILPLTDRLRPTLATSTRQIVAAVVARMQQSLLDARVRIQGGRPWTSGSTTSSKRYGMWCASSPRTSWRPTRTTGTSADTSPARSSGR
jgi:hypothetical protein